MMLAPDYGLYLINQGISKETAITFYSVPIERFTLVDQNIFTMMLNNSADDNVYAVSFDFPMSLLGNLMSFAPPETKVEVAEAIRESTDLPLTIQLSDEFSVGLSTHLGELQHGRDDDFVPLIVDMIF